MAIKSIQLLPEIFRTDANRKFLTATLDQLISEPNLTKLNSYIGRKNAPTFKAVDTYINEPSVLRQDYQLEPSVVVTDSEGDVVFYNHYIDLLQQISHRGGLVNNHSRLFDTKTYNFDGLFDFDKFVNFNQYLWLPDGPPAVTVSATSTTVTLDYSVTRDLNITGYKFTGSNTNKNPIITLVKGNKYTFNVNQTGTPFWIQTAPGVTGSSSVEAETLSRTILGLDNNGIDSGVITFNVPLKDAQDTFINATLAATVDIATDLPYNQVQNHLANLVADRGGLDGLSTSLDGKLLIFINRITDNTSWTAPGNFDKDRFDQEAPYEIRGFEYGTMVPGSERFNIFRIREVDVGSARKLITLEPYQAVANGEKVFVRAGKTNANVQFYKTSEGFYEPIVPATAPLTELYYQDDSQSGLFGTIKLLDPGVASIDVEAEIIGQLNYTSPNGIKFTNGLKVTFDSSVTPAVYANNTYIVEGVGRAIRLVGVGNLVVPEKYAVASSLQSPDYITVNRASQDLNAWSRSNRWFHRQTVEDAAKYRNDPSLLTLEGMTRAQRPIIEFEPDLYLFEHGRSAKAPIDILDFTITDAFRQVEGQSNYVIRLPNGVTRQLTAGTRIIFANDEDPLVRRKIYRVEFITTTAGTKIHLVSQSTRILPTYYVTDTKITSNLAYSFVPTVTFSAPLPVIGSATATGEVFLKPTGVQELTVNYSGVNYIADPTIKVTTAFTTEVQSAPVYRAFNYVDYIRVDDGGTAYTTTTPAVTVSSPNRYEAKVKSTSLGPLTFEISTVSVNPWDGIEAGAMVIGPGIIGGTTVDSVDTNANTIVLSAPSIVSGELTGLSTIAVDDTLVFKSTVDAGTFATTANAVANSTLVTVDDTSMIAPGMIVSGGQAPIEIQNVIIASVPTRIITASLHNLVDGDVVLVRSVAGTTELNFTRYYVQKVSDTAVDLYNNSTLTTPLDARSFTDYTSGGTLTGFTIDYGTTKVDKVLSPTQFTTSAAVTVKAGTKLTFAGVTATALARSDSNSVYAVTVTNPGAGYSTVPTVTIESSGGNQAVATAITNDDVIEYVNITVSGNGYGFRDDLAVSVISQVEVETSTATTYGSSTLEFETSAEVKDVKAGWLVFLSTQIDGTTRYTDFGQTPYADSDTTGPNDSNYKFYMDVTKTAAVVRRVQSVDSNRIVLDGPVNSLDSDGEVIDLPAGSVIHFTAQSRFFTEDGVGSSSPVTGTLKNTFILSRDAVDTSVVELESVAGIQTGMRMQSLSDSLASDVDVISVDQYLKRVTLTRNVILTAGSPVKFETNSAMDVILTPATIDYIDITNPGAEYTCAPVVTIAPVAPAVTRVATCDGTDTLTVDNYTGILLGSEVTSEYDNSGAGITTGAELPTVSELFTVQTGSNTFSYKVRLNKVQPVFSDVQVTFTKAAKAIAVAESSNIDVVTSDATPDTYEAEDSILVSIPANESQLLTGLETYYGFYFDGTSWKPAQQKTDINQAPLYDVYDQQGYSASDNSVYLANKFAGTKIFGYKVGVGTKDTVLGFPLSYRTFQNVGDIEFANYFQTDTFDYLNGFREVSKSINTFVLRQKVDTGYRIRNIWNPVTEKTKQYQVINHVFDNITNYFEIDILPEPEFSVPNIKVLVDNKIIPSTTYSITAFGGRNAVVIDLNQLSTSSKVEIQIYSKQQSTLGHYIVPVNLDNNPLNSSFDGLTLGQVRKHLSTMASNHFGTVGEVLGSNNLRDLDIKGWQGAILQHASPVALSSLSMVDPHFDVIKSIEFAQKEYTKFKNRFLDLASKIEIDINNIPASVDLILDTAMRGKSKLAPWYDSDMIPYGSLRTVTDIPVLNAQQRTYLIPKIFNDTEISRRAVLVYLRDDTTGLNLQLIKGTDFVFETATSAITIADHIVLDYSQRIAVVDYASTLGCYVPETPTKLGLYPKFLPRTYTDDTYQTPTVVIQGHDGSITPAFGDFRDQLLMELELRIYNNIKIDYQSTINDLYDVLPGKFRKTDYSRDEFDRLLTKSFLNWIGNNKLNYSANTYFQANNPWTWTYNRFRDVDSEFLPGYWRGIYKYFYDTDRPNTCPWEMLGFTEKPTWWEGIYGTAPYTGGNKVMWQHLEEGYIYAGSRQGYDARFARPGLMKIIPVDDTGALISPEKLVVASFNGADTSTTFIIGDHSPVETAWRRSSDFPYAMQIALALAKPAFYFGSLFDVSRYKYNADLDQYVFSNTLQRATPANLSVPEWGQNNADVVLTSGYINWVRDYLVYKGINGSSKIAEHLQNVSVQLSYKVAGYTDKKFLHVVAEQSSVSSSGRNTVVPDENYKIHLFKGTPVQRLVYSAVIVEKTANGWSVSGYDTSNPYFTIIPSEPNNNAYNVKVLALSATVYKDFKAQKVTVPYGYEFRSQQQVVDFLISYGRYLTGIGFVFDIQNADLETRQDWVLSAREFLTWSQQGWKPGNVLVLSPTFTQITVVNEAGIIDQITNESTGSRILDQNFALVRNNQFTVTREGNIFTVSTLNNQTIALADLNLVQYEHVVVFDNKTVFGDVLYTPESGDRQYRLRLVGYKSADWTGQLYAPGFIYNNDSVDAWVARSDYRKGSLVSYKNRYYMALTDVPASNDFAFSYWKPVDKNKIKTGLLPNFSSNAKKFEDAYDLEAPIWDEHFEELSEGIIGYRDRAFFEDFDLDPAGQVKFYQGFIKHKGTKAAVDALARGQFDNISSQVDLYEEWALRVGEYGSYGGDQYLEVILDEVNFTDNPSTFLLIDRNETPVAGYINFDFSTIYRTSEETYTKNIVNVRSDNKPRLTDNITAGYPRLDDIDGTIYNINDYAQYDTMVSDIGAGFKLWTAVDFNRSWNVYRATETNVLLTSLTLSSNDTLTFDFDVPHGAVANDLIVIKNFDPLFDGFYRVKTVLNNLQISVTGYKNLNTLLNSRTLEGSGVYFRMESVRFSKVSEILDVTPAHGWRNNDRVWIDNDTAPGEWGVYQKTDGWGFNQLLPLRNGEERYAEGYGSELRISTDNQIILAGTPAFGLGSLSGLRVVNPGSNYSSPAVIVDNPEGTPGVLAQFTVTVVSGTLTSANIVAQGSGYSVAPNVSIVDTSTITTTAATTNDVFISFATVDAEHVYASDTVVCESAGITLSNNITVVEAPESGEVRVSSAVTIPLGANVTFARGTAGTVSAVLTATTIDRIEVVDGGSGFVLVPQIDIVGGGGIGATATAEIAGGIITNVIITNPGSGYTEEPTVVLLTNNPVAVTLKAKLSLTSVASLVITNAGTGYREPTLAFTPSTLDRGTGAEAAVSLYGNGAVSGFTILNRGKGYGPSSTITLENGGSGAGFVGTVNTFANGKVNSITITNRGLGYAGTTTANISYFGGTGVVGTIDRTNNSIGDFIATNTISLGQGYLRPPQVTVVDRTGSGSGAVVEAVFPTGQIKTFLRPDKQTNGLEETELIKVFSPDAREFGHSVDIGTLLAVAGAPGTYNETGAALVCQSLGSQWISRQSLYAPGLVPGDRFGHAVAISSDERWIYVGAPGANKVYAYGIKNQEYARVIIEPTGATSYPTNLLGLQTAYEVSVLGSDGKLYEPIFDYDVDSLGNIYFATYDRIKNQSKIYITRQRLGTTIVPTVIRNITQRTYRLTSRPESIEQILVFGASGRVFVPYKEYDIVGSDIVFLDNAFLTEPTITVKQQEAYYALVDVLEPTDTVNADANFGAALSIDAEGYKIIVGAPDYAQNGIDAVGRAYVFNRSYEVLSGTGNSYIFTLALRNVITVAVDNIILRNYIDYEAQANSIVFAQTPRNGAKIKVDTNFFNLIQVIEAEAEVNQGKFGATVDIADDNRSIVVGAPGYRDVDYYNGAVYRYVNQGLFYGTIKSSKAIPTSALGDTIKVNDRTVYFQNNTTGDLALVARNLNSSDLVAVTALVTTDGFIELSVGQETNLRTLDVLPGVGDALDSIGFNVYVLTQTLFHPRQGVPEKFGTKIRLDNSGNTLLISSEGGNTLKTVTFDGLDLVFDKDTTRFIDSLNNSGAVYVYDYLSPPGETLSNPGKLLYNQVLQNANILFGDNFGSAIDINNGWAVVGADESAYYTTRGGLVHLFINDGDVKGWSRLRVRNDKVDIDYINRVVAYDKDKQVIVSQFDYYDPAKGKILGIADQDIDYKTSYDPATYNRGTKSTVTITDDQYWNEVQVSNVWWDLSKCRYIDYEQGDTNYRSQHWGETFPGSKIELCEWVESYVLPSEYSASGASGQAKYPDDSAYVEINFFDTTSGLFKTKYYFWVINKTTVDRDKTRRVSSVVAIENIIRSPHLQDVPYLAAIAPNAFNVYNAGKYLNASDTVLRIEYSRVISDIISHSEYELIQQGNPLSSVPDKLIAKLVDSLAGENSAGSVVPDLKLGQADAYGISMLPRQSMVRDAPNAIRVFASFVNDYFLTKEVAKLADLSRFKLKEPVPPSNVGFYHTTVETVDQLNYILPRELFIGYKVLVNQDSDYFGYWTIYEYQQYVGFRLVRIQSYDTSRWWNFQDWYADGYDSTVTINYTVNRYGDMVKLSPVAGNIIKVMNDSGTDWALYRVEVDLSLTKIASGNGTLQLSSELFDYNLSQTGFDNAAFDQVGFSTTQATELRNIFEGMVYDIFIGEDRVKVNTLFFTLLNYILSEQPAIDWALKTSFLSVVHKIRKLQEFPYYIEDNQTYYEDYINEVKPYRTQVREYMLDYQGLEETAVGMSDFDFPSIYDSSYGSYRQLDPSNARDLELIKGSERVNWLNNYSYSIQSITLLAGGSGYTSVPRVVITGNGTGATARAVLGNYNSTTGTYSVVDVILESVGKGFTAQPTLSFVGGNGTGAKAYIQLVQDANVAVSSTTLNKKVRTFTTKLKFDRVNYTSSVRLWKPYEIYQPNDIIVIPDVRVSSFSNYSERVLPRFMFAYRVKSTLLGRNTIDLNVFEDATIVEKLSGSDFENTNDRLAAYNQPGSPDNARIYSSPDTIRLDPSSINNQIVSVGNQWNAIVHSLVVPATHEYQYIAVGDSSLIGISKDGINWSTTTVIDTTVNCRDAVLYNGTTWAVVGNQGTLITSSDAETWTREYIDSYRYNPSVDNATGVVQENVAQTLDVTSIASAATTLTTSMIVVGNNGLILANPRGNSYISNLLSAWFNVKVQQQLVSQSYLKVVALDFGYIENIDGTQYSVEIQPVSGYFVQSATASARKMKLGYLITVGVNGAVNLISYNALDDMLQGYVSGYNYENGKADNLGYPWVSIAVPASVRGLGDGLSGQQLTNIAVSDADSRWLVAVGSAGTLLWNKIDSNLEVRNGRAELAADTIGKTVVGHGTHVFQSFREFDEDNFVAPLTKAQLADVNFNDVTWDGEKFVAVSNQALVLWGTPGVQTDAYIEITNLDPSKAVSSRRASASWSAGTAITSLVISIDSTDIDGGLIIPGMTCYATGLPADAVVSDVNLSASPYQITVNFASTNVTAGSDRALSFAYVITANVAANTTIVASNGVTSVNLNVSKLADKGDTRLYINNYDGTVQPNWTLSGTGIPTGARVKFVGKFAKFEWKLAPGVQRNVNFDYRSIAVNTTTLQISQPLAANGNVFVGNTITFYDSTGTQIQLTSTQRLRSNTTTLCFESTSTVEAGYVLQPDANLGILPGTTVVSTINYTLGGVLSRLEKDIPDFVPGTSYPGVKVTGTGFTDTGTDALSMDTTISSEFTDELGVNPEDIIVDGGKFIDTYSSHAPQELVPGRVVDSLQMNVFTKDPLDSSSIVAFKIFAVDGLPTTYYRLTAENTTALAQALYFDDTEIIVTDISKLPDPNPALNILGSVWINGEKINYLGIDRARNALTNIRRGALRTSIPMVHALGALVADASIEQFVDTDTTTPITEDVIVNNGIVGGANTATYLSSVTTSIAQGQIWQDLN